MAKKRFIYEISDTTKTYFRCQSLKEVRQRSRDVPAHCVVIQHRLRGGVLSEPTSRRWPVSYFYSNET